MSKLFARMAFDNLFCPIKTNKPKESKKLSPRATSTNENAQNNNIGQSSGHSKQTPTPYRYVKAPFQAELSDEISVMPGDAVLYQYTDTTPNGIWSHVLCLRTNQSGFVPNGILTNEPMRAVRYKKMPRCGDSSGEHHQSHHSPNHKLSHYSNKPITQDDNQVPIKMLSEIRDQPHHQRLNIAHSLQGSSGQQTLLKDTDLRYFCPTGYYNLNAPDSHCGHSEMECRPMHLTDCGHYLVLHNFVAREERDINVDPGEIVTVLNKDDPDWYWICRHDDRREGFVPANFICQYEQVEALMNKGNSTATMKSGNPIDFHTYINHTHKPDSLKDSLPTDQQSVFLNV